MCPEITDLSAVLLTAYLSGFFDYIYHITKMLCLQNSIYTVRKLVSLILILNYHCLRHMAPSPPASSRALPASPYKRIITYSNRHKRIATPPSHNPHTSSTVQPDNLPSRALNDVIDLSHDDPGPVANVSKNTILSVRILLTYFDDASQAHRFEIGRHWSTSSGRS